MPLVHESATHMEKVTHMLLKRIMPLIVLLMLVSISLVTAQEDLPPLRELAEQNDFYIGAAARSIYLSDPQYTGTLAQEFNMITPEQEAKFCELQPQQGTFDFDELDRLIDFAEENDMVVRGHTLLWHRCTPDWVLNGEFSREEAIDIMREHIFTVMQRYQGRIAIWDVVNEAMDDNGNLRNTIWLQLIGEEYIDLAFQFAREADPDALLFYNDYDGEGRSNKANAIYELVAGMVGREIPIDGVGLQMHIDLGDSEAYQAVNTTNLTNNLNRLGELGLQVQITEMDVYYEGEATEEVFDRQAGDYYRVLQTCLNHEACTALVIWGVHDQVSWLRQEEHSENTDVEPLIFDGEYQPKPAYFALLDVLARAAGAAPVLRDEVATAYADGAILREIVIPEPTLSNEAQLAPDAVNGVAYYAPFPVYIELDGDLADWENVPRVVMGDTSEEAAAESVTFAAAADDTNFYFMANVRDSNLVYGIYEPLNEWYKEDSVEFYLNTTDNLFATSYSTGIAQIGVLAANIENPEETIFGGYNGADVNVTAVAIGTEDGYIIEAAVPLENDVWTITPANGQILGFQVHLNGAASAEDSQTTKLIWSAADADDQSWRNPSVFGRLIFWDVNSQ